MQKRFLRAALISATLLASAIPAAAQTGALPEKVAGEIAAPFADFARENPVPGMVYVVMKDGKVALSSTSGVQSIGGAPVAMDSRFRIASMSKAFTGLAILKLRDEGKLSLDDLAEKYMPEMRGWTYPTSDSPRIRVRDLLVHVSGMVTDDPWGDRQQVLSEEEFSKMIAAGVPWSRVPQLRHEYSNYGYALLGRIISNASGQRYQDYIGQTILKPLGMADTTYDIGAVPAAKLAVGYRWENARWVEEPRMRDGAFGAMGGMITTANDYAKWVSFLLSAWPARDGAETGPVKRATVREMVQGLNFVRVSARRGAPQGDTCRHATAYGVGMRITSDCDLGTALEHGGGYPGYGSYVVLAPERGVAAFAFANRTYQAPAIPVWQALWSLARNGQASAPAQTVPPLLTLMHGRARAVYDAGNLQPLAGQLAMNFLLDKSEAEWKKELAGLKAQVGECGTVEPLETAGDLSVIFRWNCARGTLDGQVLLAPTNPPSVQALRFRAQPKE